MKKVIIVIAALAILDQAPKTEARETKVTGGLSTGYDYFDRGPKGTEEVAQEEAQASDAAGQENEATPARESSADEDDYRKIIVQPLIAIESVSEKDRLEIRYEPGFNYDELNDEHDLNHRASFSGQRQVTRKWQVQLSDSYEIRDDADEIATAEDLTGALDTPQGTEETTPSETSTAQTATDQGRRRYATNSLQALSQYEYLAGSSFSLGYTNSLLRNDDDAGQEYEDYDKHDGLLAVAHRFNEKWKLAFAGHYVRGLFEQPEDESAGAATTAESASTDTTQTEATATTSENELTAEDLSDDVTEYSADISLESAAIRRQPLSLGYSLRVYDYDSELLDDSQIHDLTFGWQWEYSPHLGFNASAGPSYAVTDNQDDTWGYNGGLGVNYKLERGSFSITAEKGLDRQNFTGETDNNGLIDYWNSRVSFSYNLLASTTVSLFAGYRYEDEDQEIAADTATQAAAEATSSTDTTPASTEDTATTLTETVNTQRLTAGCSLNYSFWQWYGLKLSYTYADQISDTPEDEYDEHQVVLTLSFAKELFRW